MGYQSGYGVPFFGVWTTPAAPKEKANGPMAEYAYKLHKYAGVALEYGVALHIAGSVSYTHLTLPTKRIV